MVQVRAVAEVMAKVEAEAVASVVIGAKGARRAVATRVDTANVVEAWMAAETMVGVGIAVLVEGVRVAAVAPWVV